LELYYKSIFILSLHALQAEMFQRKVRSGNFYLKKCHYRCFGHLLYDREVRSNLLTYSLIHSLSHSVHSLHPVIPLAHSLHPLAYSILSLVSLAAFSKSQESLSKRLPIVRTILFVY